MIQSTSYNLTDKESTLLKVSAKKFKTAYEVICRRIRSFIDPGAAEYKLNGFTKTEEGLIQEIWYKLLCIMSAFHADIDFKALIHENVKKKAAAYGQTYYEGEVKCALAEYILFLRTGSRTCYDQRFELAENMTIDSMVDLLSGELYLRTSFYKNKNMDEMVVEIATLHYDYDEIYKEYGVDKTRCYNPEDEDYPVYEEYIQYITTYAHTKRLINYRRMIALMYAR